MSLLVYARTPVQQLASYIGKSKRLRESYKRLGVFPWNTQFAVRRSDLI
jgi:hypothetical protein